MQTLVNILSWKQKRTMKLKDLIYSFSGGDRVIIKQCDAGEQKQFMLVGLFVPLVFILCFISSAYTFNNVFDNLLTACIMALIFAWMIANIYRLLLYTLAKTGCRISIKQAW